MFANFSITFLLLAAAIWPGIYAPAAFPQKKLLQRNTQPQPAPPIVAGHADMIPDAPDFELKDLHGKTGRLQQYRGKAVLLNFWATWCVPCKTEMPWLNEFQVKYGHQGLVVLGIAMDTSPGAVRKFAKKAGANYSILMGTQAVADQYMVKAYPITFYIDRNGRITDQVAGLAPRHVIENEIKLALKSGRPL